MEVIETDDIEMVKLYLSILKLVIDAEDYVHGEI